MSSSRSLPTLAFATWSLAPALHGNETRLIQLLTEAGCSVKAVVWDDPEVCWERFDHVIVRSTWDYFEKYPQFLAWLEKLESAGCRISNSASLLRWNSNKLYLREIESRGCDIVPTVFVEKKSKVTLTEILQDHHWQTIIIKPTVSGAAWRTWKFDRHAVAEYEEKFSEILEDSEAMVQPYLAEIESEGELSLLYFGGKFSHAVRKLPAAKDFRVQGQFGGTFEIVPPEKHVLAAAEKSLSTLPEKPLYARVDGVVVNGKFKLMEMELIEPFLYFSEGAPEAANFVQSIVTLLKSEHSKEHMKNYF